jgi:FSR family fosmidomycin resistance protein-like MFS transporter
VELFDELVYGAREAAWPLIRNDLGLSYATVGILISAPGLFASLVEPSFGLLAATGRQRLIILAGGCAFGASLLFAAVAWGYVPLLVGFAVMGTASGAFVSISQAALMEAEPGREEANMARWVLAGSVGVVLGPITLAAAIFAGFGWRSVFLAFGAAIIPLVFAARSIGQGATTDRSLGDAIRLTRGALERLSVLRWLFLVEVADLMGDVLFGFLALYLVDVVHMTPALAAVAVAVWTGAGLLGDALLVRVLAHTPGVVLLRLSALVALAVYPGFLLPLPLAARLILLGSLGLIHAGWYAIPTGRLYAEVKEGSGVAVALSSAAGLLGQFSPLLIGLAAQRFGLATAMWIPLLAPIALLLGVPHQTRGEDPSAASHTEG